METETAAEMRSSSRRDQVRRRRAGGRLWGGGRRRRSEGCLGARIRVIVLISLILKRGGG